MNNRRGDGRDLKRAAAMPPQGRRSKSPRDEPAYGAADDNMTIYLYENGNEYAGPKRFAFSQRKTKSWDALLQQVTDVVKPKSGYVRSLHTPEGGTRIRGFGELRFRDSYVAVSTWEQYKPCERVDNYLLIEEPTPFKVKAALQRELPTLSDTADLDVREMLSSGRDASPRGGNVGVTQSENVVIYCYLNGDAVTPPLPVVLRPLDFSQMQIVLTRITERLKVDERLARPLRRLYTTGGDRVYQPVEIEAGEEYVAAPLEPFKDANYGKKFPPLLASQMIDRKKVKQLGYLSLSALGIADNDELEPGGHRSRSRERGEPFRQRGRSDSRSRGQPARRSRSETPRSSRMSPGRGKRAQSDDRTARGRSQGAGRGTKQGGVGRRGGPGNRPRSRSGSRSQSRSQSRTSSRASQSNRNKSTKMGSQQQYGGRKRQLNGKFDERENKRGKNYSKSPGKAPRSPGRGNQRSPGRGGSRSPGRGNQRSPGRGGSRSPGRGDQRGLGRGNQRNPGRGGLRSPGRGDQRSPGRGGSRSPGRGNQRGPDRGGSRSPGRGNQRGPDRGGSRSPGRGDQRGVGRGNQRGPDRGGSRSPGRGDQRSQGRGNQKGPVRGSSRSPRGGEQNRFGRGKPESFDSRRSPRRSNSAGSGRDGSRSPVKGNPRNLAAGTSRSLPKTNQLPPVKDNSRTPSKQRTQSVDSRQPKPESKSPSRVEPRSRSASLNNKAPMKSVPETDTVPRRGNIPMSEIKGNIARMDRYGRLPPLKVPPLALRDQSPRGGILVGNRAQVPNGRLPQIDANTGQPKGKVANQDNSAPANLRSKTFIVEKEDKPKKKGKKKNVRFQQ